MILSWLFPLFRLCNIQHFKTPSLNFLYQSLKTEHAYWNLNSCLKKIGSLKQQKQRHFLPMKEGVWHLIVTILDTAVSKYKPFRVYTCTKFMHELVNIIHYVLTRNPKCFGKCICLNNIKLLAFDHFWPTKKINLTWSILI